MFASLILGLGLGLGMEISESWDVAAAAGFGTHETALEAGFDGHFYGLDFYDRYFGYSAFDPFWSVGVKGWIGSKGAVGPKTGFGAYYHFDDHWSLRGDADVTLNVERRVSTLFSLSLGIQYTF